MTSPNTMADGLMKSVLIWIMVLVCPLAARAGDAGGLSGAEPEPSHCVPSFPYKDGWVGADAAYSIPLGSGRSLWLFGDSFVAKTSRHVREGAYFIRNSIAISNCEAQSGWSINYHWRHQGSSQPRAFFDTEAEDHWYWPLDGFLHGDCVYLAVARVENDPAEKVFGFRITGVDLVRISNIEASPDRWLMRHFKLTEGGGAVPGSSVVVKDEYVYLFTLYDDPPRKHQHMIVTRLPLANLENPAASLEYLDKDRSWKAGLDREDALVILETGHSELSVRYRSDLKQWLAISGAEFLSNRIVIRTAPDLTGPWSGWQTIYEMPEMSSETAGYDADTFCYAVKEHAELRQGPKCLITYVCNSFKFEKVIANLAIYRPRVIAVEIPPPK
ncbi:MAG: DUF4185 domain-containing protein [Acidobacteriota bacterium]